MGFTKVAPAGIGTEPGDGYRIGDSFLHATGISLGSGTTISHSGSASFSGIVTAQKFVGDGSDLNGVSGLGTALSNDTTSPLNTLYYVNSVMSIGSTITVNPPPTAVAVYTNYAELQLEESADLIIESGDVVPDVLGLFVP
tara:strand:- start:170 stop:592 length:423 start_codon:yes stop_codon:yes gene_type:complete